MCKRTHSNCHANVKILYKIIIIIINFVLLGRLKLSIKSICDLLLNLNKTFLNNNYIDFKILIFLSFKRIQNGYSDVFITF